ncbi:hypothetical protein BJX76DRAFT_326200 [Aspergillus varians]
MLEILFSYGFEYSPELDGDDFYSDSAVETSVMIGNFDVLLLLLDKGCRPPAEEALVRTLMRIFKRCDGMEQAEELFDLLINNGAGFDEYVRRTLCTALVERSEMALKVFLKRGVDPLSKDANGRV